MTKLRFGGQTAVGTAILFLAVSGAAFGQAADPSAASAAAFAVDPASAAAPLAPVERCPA
jgi:hypothetical protein